MLEYSIEENKKMLSNGYEIIYDLNHPLANKSGIVYVHRHVMSVKVGRWIQSTEFVHHIDGNRSNNDPDNLELTDRHTHGMTHANKHFPECNRRKEKGKRVIKSTGESIIVKICSGCGKEYETKTKTKYNGCFCSRECLIKSQRKFEISKEELEKLVWEKPTTHIAEQLGVSDKAIEKRCKRLNIQKPPRGYWRKLETDNL